MATADLDGRGREIMAPAGSEDPRIQTGTKKAAIESRTSIRLRTSRMDADGNGLPLQSIRSPMRDKDSIACGDRADQQGYINLGLAKCRRISKSRRASRSENFMETETL